jgi:DNA-binding FadR family transcriptional regulator
MNSIMKIIGEMLYRETQKIIDLSKDTKEYTIKTTYNLVKAIREGNPDEAKNFMIEHIRSIKLSLKD